MKMTSLVYIISDEENSENCLTAMAVAASEKPQ